MSYLLDTNVLSELRKKLPNPKVSSWFAGVRSSDLYLSVLVVGEIRSGVERLRRRDPSSAKPLDDWLKSLKVQFSDRTLPVTWEIADYWGRLNVPDPVPIVDGLLAATAHIHSLILVTRNVRHFPGTKLLNPFD